MIKGKKISAIVPIYNEDSHLKKVLSNILKIKELDEVICINDGSTDNCLKILTNLKDKIVLITYRKNKGKGYAVAQGVKRAGGEIVVLLDSDIINYSKEHVLGLCNPLVEGKLRFTIGIFSDVKELLLLKSIGGIRAYYKNDLIPLTRELEKSSKYGIEPILNMKLNHLKHDFVRIPNIDHIRKYDKYSTEKMISEYAIEGQSLTKEFFRIISDR
ncbi:MAG: glycosyltransferase family 2 protein [bacterium]